MDWRQVPRSTIDNFLISRRVTPGKDPYIQAYKILLSEVEKVVQLPEQIVCWIEAYQVLQGGFTNFDDWYSQSGLDYSTAVNIWYYTGLPLPPNYLNELPLELLYSILAKLDYQSLISICQVNRKFNGLCNQEEFWRYLLTEQHYSYEELKGKTREELIQMYQSLFYPQGRIYVMVDTTKEVNTSLVNNIEQLGMLNQQNWIQLGQIHRPYRLIFFLNNKGEVYAVNYIETIKLDVPPISRITEKGELLGRERNIYFVINEAYIDDVIGGRISIQYKRNNIHFAQFTTKSPVTDSYYGGARTLLYIEQGVLYEYDMYNKKNYTRKVPFPIRITDEALNTELTRYYVNIKSENKEGEIKWYSLSSGRRTPIKDLTPSGIEPIQQITQNYILGVSGKVYRNNSPGWRTNSYSASTKVNSRELLQQPLLHLSRRKIKALSK